MLTIDLARSMTAQRRKTLARESAVLTHQQSLDAEVAKLITESTALAKESDRMDLMTLLNLDYKVAEAKTIQDQRDRWAHLPQERIFTLDAIKRVCIRYNLRFLPTSLYKGALDEGIGPAIEEFKAANRGELPPTRGLSISTDVWGRTNGIQHAYPGHFFIAAPAESFVLQARPKDPILFCSLGGDRFYMVHKWGKDLSIGRLLAATLVRFRGFITVPMVWGLTAYLFWGVKPEIGSAIVGGFVFAALGSALVGLIRLAIVDDWDHPWQWLVGRFDDSSWSSPFTT